MSRFESGDRDVDDKARSGRPHTAPTPESEVHLHELIRADRRITVIDMRAKSDNDVSAVEKSTFNSAVVFHSLLFADRHK